MINFNGITHIIRNPKGTYSFVGSVPVCLHDLRNPTQSDIMGGRLHNGMGLVSRTYPEIAPMVADAQAHGATLCSSPTCACRRLF